MVEASRARNVSPLLEELGSEIGSTPELPSHHGNLLRKAFDATSNVKAPKP